MGVYDTFKDGVKTHFEHACEIHMCEDSTCFRIELCCQNYETMTNVEWNAVVNELKDYAVQCHRGLSDQDLKVNNVKIIVHDQIYHGAALLVVRNNDILFNIADNSLI